MEKAGSIPLKLKTAVVPVKAIVVTGIPFAERVTLVMPAGFPLPETERINWVRAMLLLLGFVNRICWTGTLESPASWLEFPGGLGPWKTATITAVGVEVGVIVKVGVEVAVRVGVKVAWATTMAAPATGRGLKSTGWPLLPPTPVTLKL